MWFPTSFCVTVSMMVPKAGIVDILTELKTAGEQHNGLTIHSHKFTESFWFSLVSPLVYRWQRIRMSQIFSVKSHGFYDHLQI